MSKSIGMSRSDHDLGLYHFNGGKHIDRPSMQRSKMFEKDALDAIVKKQLASIPEDKTIAMVAVVNNEGERFAIAYKPNKEWEIQGYIQNEEKFGLEYGASVQWSR